MCSSPWSLSSSAGIGASTQGCVLKTSYFYSVAATWPAGSTGRTDTSRAYKILFPIGFFTASLEQNGNVSSSLLLQPFLEFGLWLMCYGG